MFSNLARPVHVQISKTCLSIYSKLQNHNLMKKKFLFQVKSFFSINDMRKYQNSKNMMNIFPWNINRVKSYNWPISYISKGDITLDHLIWNLIRPTLETAWTFNTHLDRPPFLKYFEGFYDRKKLWAQLKCPSNNLHSKFQLFTCWNSSVIWGWIHRD